MILISAGMQKSGSAYMYFLLNEMLLEAGHPPIEQIKQQHQLNLGWYNHIQTPNNNNIGKMSLRKLWHLYKISEKTGDFVVKTHHAPTWALRFLLQFKFAKLIYTYRDPRDVYVSALDHGKKIAAEGKNHTFYQFLDQKTAFRQIDNWLKIWEAYHRLGDKVVMVAYEDLQQEPLAALQRVNKYLALHLSDAVLTNILKKYEKDNLAPSTLGALHYNKAQSGRYQTEMEPTVLAAFHREFGKRIAAMGYAV
ncbi:MAG: sulfotransferase domain-containing protein [Sphingobacteriales bacterium]|nr:sulfotransferase domain-containing protein [Sphingobacteriales bacterium]